MKTKNPVAKFNNEFNKPKVFRDRKSHAKNTGDYGDRTESAKPKHQPYKREKPVLEDGEFEDTTNG